MAARKKQPKAAEPDLHKCVVAMQRKLMNAMKDELDSLAALAEYAFNCEGPDWTPLAKSQERIGNIIREMLELRASARRAEALLIVNSDDIYGTG